MDNGILETLGGEDVEWIADVDARSAGDRAKAARQRLKEDIDDLNELQTPEECDDLLRRVGEAKARTLLAIEDRTARMDQCGASKGDKVWLHRARYAALSFDKAMYRIRTRMEMLARRTGADAAALRAAANVEHAAALAYLAAKREEEKTERHRIDRAHNGRAAVLVIRMILVRGLLHPDTVNALFQEARAAVEADGPTPETAPSAG